MADRIRIALCQTKPVTGDFEGNYRKAEEAVLGHEADLYVFPAHQVAGPGSGDLFSYPPYLLASEEALARYRGLAERTGKAIAVGCTVAAGLRWKASPAMALFSKDGGGLAVAGRLTAEEARWFAPGHGVATADLELAGGGRAFLGIVAGEADDEEIADMKADGVEIVVSVSSHAFCLGAAEARRSAVSDLAARTGMAFVEARSAGGSDETLRDGRSYAADPSRGLHEAPAWAETVDVVTLAREDTARGSAWRIEGPKEPVRVPDDAECYIAACVGLRDYMAAAGFRRAVLGLSGGADSALVALMACDVLGEEALDAVLMPSVYTSGDSNDFARDLAAGLGTGVRAYSVPISPMVDAYGRALREAFGPTDPNVAEENLQAQVRGDVLSWHSNKAGCMILSTGNRSEGAMGYATLYGDMRGGYNPLKDLYKTQVFALLEMRHALARGARGDFGVLFSQAFGRWPVPLSDGAAEALRRTIDRPPSAELAEGQRDSDSLPDYAVLDRILGALDGARGSVGPADAARRTGDSPELAAQVRQRIRMMEYKRFQACPGPRIHARSFAGGDWRYPLSGAYRG